MRVRRTLGLLVLVAVVALAACGSDDPGEGPQPSTTATTTAAPTEPATSAQARFDVPDGFDFSREACVAHFGHPCRRSEYDPEVKELQAEYADAVSQRMATESREAAFEWITSQEGVVDSRLSDNRIMFQVEGAMPFSIITPIPEPPPGFGDDVEALAAVMPAGGPTAQLISNPMIGFPAPLGLEVVGTGTSRENRQNKKNALFLEPWATDEGSLLNTSAAKADVRGALKRIHDYKDINSVVHVTDANADPAWFTSDIWAQYDFIYVSTHGDSSVSDAVLESGVRRLWNQGDDEKAVCDQLMAPYEDLIGLECGYQQPGGTNGPTYHTLDMTEIFFFSQYFDPNRQLEKAIVYIESCRSLRHAILPHIMVGTSSAYFGWTDYINL
ncbi:MAG: hypothetical protein GY720_06610, partial [bacterium]|nr:hypothetical protein [bacterium]